MRIVSQNRDLSLNFDDIDVFICDTAICTTYHDKTRVLGKYASEERVREVFEEIHKCYTGMPIIKTTGNVENENQILDECKSNSIIAVNYCNEIPSINMSETIVFHMPEK